MDRLNKIQLRTVWCSINFFFCSKQTMNVFFHCTFAWICVDFSCKTAFISYHVMSAKTSVLKCCCLFFDWTEFWESSALLNRESWLVYDDFREKTWLDHGTKSIFFSPRRLHSTKSYFIKAIDHTFYGFTGVITHLGCWANTRKACKSLAFGSWFTSFSRVLPASRVGYHAGKPIESVVYCLKNRIHYIILGLLVSSYWTIPRERCSQHWDQDHFQQLLRNSGMAYQWSFVKQHHLTVLNLDVKPIFLRSIFIVCNLVYFILTVMYFRFLVNIWL